MRVFFLALTFLFGNTAALAKECPSLVPSLPKSAVPIIDSLAAVSQISDTWPDHDILGQYLRTKHLSADEDKREQLAAQDSLDSFEKVLRTDLGLAEACSSFAANGLTSDPGCAALAAILAAFKTNYSQINDHLGYLETVRKQESSTGTQRPKLTEEEGAAIYGYTGGDYRYLNAALRYGNPLLGEMKPYIETLSVALDRLPSYEGIVHRGTTLPPEVLSQHQVGNVVTYSSFTSATTDAGWGGNTKLIIHSRGGRDVSGYSQMPQEHEILFRPFTRFKIVSREQQGDVTLITMDELSP